MQAGLYKLQASSLIIPVILIDEKKKPEEDLNHRDDFDYIGILYNSQKQGKQNVSCHCHVIFRI